METAKKTRLSLAEYNQLEEETNQRYEYHDGEVFSMAGAATDVGDPVHGAIAGNLIGLLHGGLLPKDCSVLTSDVKFYIPSINHSLYPDVSVVCGPSERSDKDTKALTNPILLIEVLSDSNAAYDRGTKFHYYSELPSLREYVLVEQHEWKVETRYRSTPDEPWQMDWFSGKEATVRLRSVDLTLPLADLYRRTEGL
jgi:Uma2 family endonuclease